MSRTRCSACQVNAGQHLCLHVAAALGQPLRRQRVVHPDHVLLDDRTLVQVRRDVVRGGVAAEELEAGLAAAVRRAAGEVSRRLGALTP